MPRTGSRASRGYGPEHVALRAKLAPTVASGAAYCWRCGQPIRAGQPWDLGHDDTDRSIYRGVEHVRCNRQAGAIKGNKMRGQRRHRANPPPFVDYSDPDW